MAVCKRASGAAFAANREVTTRQLHQLGIKEIKSCCANITVMLGRNLKRPPVGKVIIILLALVVVLPIGMISVGAAKCKLEQLSIKRSNKDKITAFENMKLLKGDATPTSVLLGGDCFESDPFVQVDRRIQTSRQIPELLYDIRQTLSEQNYVLSRENVKKHVGIDKVHCGYSYSATATGNNIKFSVSISGIIDRNESAKCGATGNRIVDESELTGQKANQVFSRLEI